MRHMHGFSKNRPENYLTFTSVVNNDWISLTFTPVVHTMMFFIIIIITMM